MSLFQLMNWLQDNNFDEFCEAIVETPDDMGYNPFELMPDNYAGTLEEWEAELDEVETELKASYIKACKQVMKVKNNANPI